MNNLADAVVQDPQGQEHRLGELWAGGPAVLVFLRHFGCLFCQVDMSQVCRAADSIGALGAKLCFIGNGTPKMALDFQQEHALKIPVFVDPSLEAYRAAGLKRGLWKTLGLRPILRSFPALAAGFRPGRLQGDPWQQGGILVVGKEGQILYAYSNQHSGDTPRIKEILDTLERREVLETHP